MIGVSAMMRRLAALLLFLPAAGALAQSGSLSLGQAHGCEVTPAGGVQCWGVNFAGQLGDGTKVYRPQPVPVSGLASGAVAVASGFNHSCALLGNGSVRCWGFNGAGQLGTSAVSESLVPIAVAGLPEPATQITVGNFFSCALLQGGSVRCWGSGSGGALGNNATANSSTPVLVQGLGGSATQVDAGGAHACAVISGGTVRCWGEGSSGQIGDGGNSNRLTAVPVTISGGPVATVAAGASHTCARLASGGVRCWGLNAQGEIGDGTLVGRNAPAATLFPPDAVEIGTASNSTCVRRSNGTVQCAGANAVGQLGNGINLNSSVPVAVSGIADALALDSALSGFFSCARRASGQTLCWGENIFGQLGIGSIDMFPTPGPIEFPGGFARLAGNDDHQCGISASGGAVHCWGSNRNGQLGNNSQTRALTVPASPVATVGSGALDIATGIAHSCAIGSGGAAFCWGFNAFGQLGDGSSLDALLPTPVTGIGSGATQVVAGDIHTCLLVNGGVRCFGQGAAGQLGTGSNGLSQTPVAVSGLTSGVSQITAGGNHACALANGAVSCWGADGNGQLGNDAALAASNVPVPVQGLGSGVVQIAAGRFHTCARLTGGELRCWGANPDGRLGDGSTTQRPTPVQVSGFASGALDLSAGFNSTCAVATGGAVRCWGEGSLGQRGDGVSVAVVSSLQPTFRSTPADAIGLGAGATRVFVGGQLGCALLGSDARCWGHNRNGALGNGKSSSYLVPVPLLGVIGGTASIEPPLPPAPTAAPGDEAGAAVAASDTLIVLGAPNAGAQQRGAVYVYTRDPAGPLAPVSDKAGLLREAKGLAPPVVLTWNGGGVGDKFGSAVALMPDDTRIAVGVPTADGGAGTVVIFSQPAGGWGGSVGAPQELDPVDGAGTTVQGFGTAVDFAIDATLAVGAPLSDSADKFNSGAVIAARGSPGGYVQLGSPLLAGTPQDGAAMGTSIAIEGGVLVAGAPLEDVGGRADQGAIHVFPDNTSSFGAPTAVSGTTGEVGDKWGTAVAVNPRGTIAVGAPDAATPLGPDTGAVFVLLPQAGGGYAEAATLLPGTAGDQAMGTAVAINGSAVVAGAPDATVGAAAAAGQVYVFNEPLAGWSGTRGPDAVLAGSGASSGDAYGRAVAASGRGFVVGVPLEDPAAGGGGASTNQGTAESFVFDRVLAASFE